MFSPEGCIRGSRRADPASTLISVRSQVSLISVVGVVSPEVLVAFLNHYTALHVDRKLLAIHTTDGAEGYRVRNLCKIAREYGAEIIEVSVGPWHEDLNERLRDQLRGSPMASRWHVLADVDEFHQYPLPLEDLIVELERRREQVCAGVLVDRFAESGHLPQFPKNSSQLDRTFPLGMFFTSCVAGGDPRKIVIAERGVAVAPGQHWAEVATFNTSLLTLVHHFKWHADVVPYLKRRREAFSSGEWLEQTPAMRKEAERVLKLLNPTSDRFALELCSAAPEAVTLNGANSTVRNEAQRVFMDWTKRFG